MENLKKNISAHLPDYMIPSYFIPVQKIPLNANGKVDRKALPIPGVSGLPGVLNIGDNETYIAPGDWLEEQMATLWAEILTIEKNKISMNADFFQLGGHSLKAMVLNNKIHKIFDVKITLADIFQFSTVRELTQYIKKTAVKESYTEVKAVEKKEYYVLSSAQKRLYILWQMSPAALVYNMPFVTTLDNVDKEKLTKTFKMLIGRHESLRTSFIVIDEKPMQKIHEEVAFEIEYYDLEKREQESGATTGTTGVAGKPIEKILQDFVKPFKLSFAPLLRVGLIHTKADKYVLIVDMHHIISDGISHTILFKEFTANNEAGLVPLRLQYKDYAEWQDSEMGRAYLTRQEHYWLERLGGELPVLDLPYDFSRPEVQSFSGRRESFSILTEEMASLKKLAGRQGATLYMVLLMVFDLFLSRLSGLEDIIVGSPVAGRSHADFQSIIGMFVNTIVLRNRPCGEKTVAAFLDEVKTGALEAFENQDYPFETLVEKVTVARDVSRNPLFDVVFALQNMGEPGRIETSAETAYESQIAKFDLTLFAVDMGEDFLFTFEYCTELFKKETIDRFIAYFKNIIRSIIEDPAQRIGDLEMLSDAEKHRLLVEFNDTKELYPNNKTLPELFELQVTRTPDNIAVSENSPMNLHQLSYRQLNEISGCLGCELYKRVGSKQNPVGLLVNRSLEMIIGILAILKAGCGYVPLNPRAPEMRSKYMLEESHADTLLTTSKLYETSKNWKNEIIFIDKFLVSSQVQSPGFSVSSSSAFSSTPLPSYFAYVIFTSGSTGTPKGVPITHANLCPLLQWGYSLGLGSQDRFLQNLSYYFDWSVWEIFIALTTG
ncbi:MAG: condensation domain-containing protein, partial [Acidobacteria bacterium]|nr:condensation domain-containing protein [Acidobacteriota bacterium]